MNFIKLKIHNIASISDAEIRFNEEPFASSPLFLIYGQTGSGKTTILDAICLALYDQAPRLDTLNQKKRQYEDEIANKGVRNVNDVSNLIRKGASDAVISLTFRGNDANIYIATWIARFGVRGAAKGKFLDIDRSLSHVGTDFIWEKKTDVEKMILSPGVVGLSYENFLRTTILPQGAFNRFLSAGQSEKAEILEKLVGLNRFTEIGERITKKYKIVSEELKLIENEIEKLDICSQKEYDALRDSLNVNSEEAKDVSEKIKQEQEKINWVTTYAKVRDTFSKAEKDLEESSGKVNSDSFIELVNRLAIRDELSPYRELQKNINEISKTVKSYEAELVNLGKEKVNLEFNLDILRRNLINNSTKILGLKTQLSSYFPYNFLIDNEKEVLGILDSYNENSSCLIQEETSLKRCESEFAKVSDSVNKISEIYVKLEKEERELRENSENLSAKLNELNNKPTIVYRKELIAWRTYIRINDLNNRLLPLKESEPSLVSAYRLADDHYKHLELSTLEAAKSLRANLRIGDKCPVCNSKIVELVSEDVFKNILAVAEQPRQEAKRLLEENENAQREIESNIRSLFISISSLGIEKADSECTQKAIHRRMSEQFGTNISEEDITALIEESEKDSENFDSIGSKLLKTGKLLTLKVQEVKKVSQQLTEAKVLFETKLVEINNKRENIFNLARKIETQKEEISKIFNVRSNFVTAELKEWSKNLISQYNTLNKEYLRYNQGGEMTSSAIDRIKISLAKTATLMPNRDGEKRPYEPDDIKGISEHYIERFNFVSGKILSSKNLRTKYINKMDDFKIHCSGQCRSHLSDPTLGLNDLEAKRKEDFCNRNKQDLKDKTFVFEKARLDLEELIQNRPESLSDECVENPELIQSTIHSLEEKLGNLNQQIGSFVQQIKDFESKSKKMKKLNEKFNKIRSSFDIYANLNSYFGEAHFREVICEYILAHLLENANIYLKSFSDRYSMFTQPGNLEIMIKDNFTGEQRVFSTLSGGETFMASLALALGLASLQNVKNTPDIFFIDEGFGSLSSECLESVMSTLDNLRKIESRRVGIVSHVESLRDRIPVRLAVHRHGSISQIVTETD